MIAKDNHPYKLQVVVDEKWDKPVPNVCQTVSESEQCGIAKYIVFSSYRDFEIDIYEQQKNLRVVNTLRFKTFLQKVLLSLTKLQMLIYQCF
ncbi:MAG: hypothetical protein RSE41_08025 [Clostridia bacterium]